MAKIIIRFNRELGGIECVVPDDRKLSSNELQILKEVGFRWHKTRKHFWAYYTPERMELIRATFLGKEAQFPAKTEDKVMKGIAADLAQAREERKTEKRAARKSAAAPDTDAIAAAVVAALMQAGVIAAPKAK